MEPTIKRLVCQNMKSDPIYMYKNVTLGPIYVLEHENRFKMCVGT